MVKLKNMKGEKFYPISFKSIYGFLSVWRNEKANNKLLNEFILINKLEARSHDGKYYSCNSMRAIRAGLDIRNLNNENINFSTFTDRVQTGK